jgi:hypothetical protein
LNCGCKIDKCKNELTFAASSNGDNVKHPAAKFQLRLWFQVAGAFEVQTRVVAAMLHCLRMTAGRLGIAIS